jgi:NAD(P)-dependent dehydrogenase (short-subunit alcohol dehydrogenase family)
MGKTSADDRLAENSGRYERLTGNRRRPGVEPAPMCSRDDWKQFVTTYQPMGRIPEVKDGVDAVLYLTDAGQVTGEVLHVDGGAHVGKW